VYTHYFKSVYIIILNWNGYKDTIACIESCLQSTYPNFHLLIVDNGSSDNSETIILQRFPGIEIMQTGSNLGFAGGNNVGIRRALSVGVDYIWLLNNDTIVAPDALAEMVKSAENAPRVGMVGSKILFHDQPSKIWFAGGFWTVDGGNLLHRGFGEEDVGQYDTPCGADFLTGCSLLVKTGLIGEIGQLRDDYFLYWEDADWSRRAVEGGWDLLYAPAARVWHKVSASAGNRSATQWYFYTRNACLFIERHRRSHLLSHLINHQGHQLRKALHEKDWQVSRGIITGLRDYLLRRFGMRN
jgi:GT2 family glycosyltransferase